MKHNLDTLMRLSYQQHIIFILLRQRPTYIEFSDVANSGAIDLIIISGSTDFMSFSISNGISLYQPLQ